MRNVAALVLLTASCASSIDPIGYGGDERQMQALVTAARQCGIDRLVISPPGPRCRGCEPGMVAVHMPPLHGTKRACLSRWVREYGDDIAVVVPGG
jgi:hypothetical protein